VSQRQRFIRPAIVARPELIAQAFRRIANILDQADDQRKVTFYCHLMQSDNTREVTAAWSQVALLLADENEIDTSWLRLYANTIDKGVQDVLPTA
jgi:hypothetical protein